MKRTLVLALIFSFASVHAQFTGASGNNFYAIDGGITGFNPFELNDAGNGISERFSHFYTYGICMSGETGGRYGDYADGTLALHFFHPNKIEWYTDSSSLTERGWEVMTSIFGFDVIRNQKLDFVLGPGVFWGNLKLISESHGGPAFRYKYNNPFVAPMVRADFRIILGNAAVLGLRVSYRYDITRPDWKSDDGGTTLPGYRFREGQYLIYFGWKVFYV